MPSWGALLPCRPLDKANEVERPGNMIESGPGLSLGTYQQTIDVHSTNKNNNFRRKTFSCKWILLELVARERKNFLPLSKKKEKRDGH